MTIRRYYLGCPLWSNRDWIGRLFSREARLQDMLRQYSEVFNTVEGNTTFYGMPSADAVARWRVEARPGFRFCFKVPQRISHDLRLQGAQAETHRFLELLAPLEDRLGPLWLQLHRSFGPGDLPLLEAWLDALPRGFQYAVEVRHPGFFDKGEGERTLNRLLRDRGVDRVCLDSRGLFKAPDTDPDTRDAQRRKPRLPVHPVVTATRPWLRYIGHPVLEENDRYLDQWADRIAQWLEEGVTPYVFVHTPNNRHSPELALRLHERIAGRVDGIGQVPPWPGGQDSEQLDLF